MGIIKKIYADQIINPKPDRQQNRIFIYQRGEDDQIGIHYRNISFKLTPQEFKEWQEAFKTARQKFLDSNKILYEI
jgi:hypothetical protein